MWLLTALQARTSIKNPTALCVQSKNRHCCVVQKPTQQHLASWAELSDFTQGQAGQVSDFKLYCNWFVSGFSKSTVGFYISLFQLFIYLFIAFGVKQTARSQMHSIHSFSKLGEDLENVDRLPKGKWNTFVNLMKIKNFAPVYPKSNPTSSQLV